MLVFFLFRIFSQILSSNGFFIIDEKIKTLGYFCIAQKYLQYQNLVESFNVQTYVASQHRIFVKRSF